MSPTTPTTDLYSSEIQVVTQVATGREIRFEPQDHNAAGAAIRTHALIVANWGTAVGISVAHSQSDWRLRLNWFKKSEPSESSVILVDKENNQYYFPIGTDLKGEVLPGHPRTGVVVFERFRVPTTRVELQFSNVKLTSNKGDNHSFSFSCSNPSLRSNIVSSLSQPSISESVLQAIQREEEKLKEHVRKSNSGCLLFVATLGSLLGLFLVLASSRLQ